MREKVGKVPFDFNSKTGASCFPLLKLIIIQNKQITSHTTSLFYDSQEKIGMPDQDQMNF